MAGLSDLSKEPGLTVRTHELDRGAVTLVRPSSLLVMTLQDHP